MRPRLTSIDSPLRIDEVELRGNVGRIGLTLCPGKNDAHGSYARWERDLALDIEQVRTWGASSVVTLMELDELDFYNVSALGEAVAAADLEWLHLPIIDGSVPDARFEDRWNTSGRSFLEGLRDGKSAVIHCLGGLGRTGLFAAIILIEFGYEPVNAIRRVRTARQGTIETISQVSYVEKYTPRFAIHAG